MLGHDLTWQALSCKAYVTVNADLSYGYAIASLFIATVTVR